MKGDKKLVNFNCDEELYFDIEAIAKANNRSTTGQLVYMMEREAQEYKETNNIKKIPRTEARKEKMKVG